MITGIPLGLVIVIAVAVAALCVAYIITLETTNRSLILKTYENSTIILSEVHHMLATSMRVTQDTKHLGDFYRDIEIFHLDSGCSGLPTHDREPIAITNGNDFATINATTFYALGGSHISFDVCGKTNSTTTDRERLEMILQKEQQARPASIDFFNVGISNEWLCTSTSLPIPEPGYYSITFLPPTHDAEFEFNATYNLNEIDTENLLKRATGNYTLHRDEETVKILLTYGAKESCVVATIHDNPTTLSQTAHIQINILKPTAVYIIVGGVLLFSAVIIALIIVVASRTYRKCTQNSKPIQTTTP